MFEISKTRLPIPPSKTGRQAIYPFCTMEVGEHFDAPDDMGKSNVGASKRQSSISATSRKPAFKDKKFATRKVDGIIRCWREA